MKEAINKIVLFLLLSAHFAVADDQFDQRYMETHKENFVKEIMNDMSPTTDSLNLPNLDANFQNEINNRGAAEKSEERQSESPQWLNEVTYKQAQPTKIEQILEDKPGVKVRSLGAILALSNAQSMDKDITTLVATSTRLNVGLGHVFFVLSSFELPQLSREMLEPLKKYGADTHIRLAPPTEYKSVKKAPAWIVSTEKGDVLLEGTHEPLSFFNSRGEFVEPTTSITPQESR